MKNPAEDQPVPPPTDGAPPQPTPPVDDGVLWLVSFAEDDDRELRPADIAASLRRGEIDSETIVWRDGMEDWTPLGRVPSLARLMPSSGETANAPLVIPNHGTSAAVAAAAATTTASSSRALVPRTKGNEPSKPLAKIAAEVALSKQADRAAVAASSAASAANAAATMSAPGGTNASATTTAPGGTSTSDGTSASSGTSASATTTAPGGTSTKHDSKPPPVVAAKTAEPWRGKTRLGLPQPPEIKRIPAPSGGTNAGAKKPDVGVKAQTPNAPRAAVARTPNAPRAAIARSPSAPKVGGADAPASSKGGAASIWEDEEDGPISIDPESSRPLSPTPSLVNATALSRGTLGNLPRKPPPPAPRPPGAKPAPLDTARATTSGASGADATPAVDRRSNSETPGISQLAGPIRAAARVDDDILNLGGGAGMSAALLAPPAMDLAAFGEDPVFSAEGPPMDAIEVPLVDDETATVPTATAVAPRATSAASGTPAKTVPTAVGSSATAAAPAKKRSVLPFVLGAAVALYVASLGLRKAPPAEAPPAAVPAEPEAPRAAEPQAATEPAPTPTAAAPAPEPAAPGSAVAAAAPGPSPQAATGSVTTSRVAGSKPETAAIAKPEAHAATPESDKPTPAAKKPEPETKPAHAASPEPEPKQVDMGGDFDKAAASAALGTAANQASGCRKDGDPTGVAVVHVTFANSGRATRATIEGPPFAGTATGGCIAAALRGAKVPPFGGDRVTVTKRVVIQ